MPSSTVIAPASCCGSLTSQLRCGSRRIRPPLAPPRLSEWRYDDAAAQAVDTSWETVRPESAIFALTAAIVSADAVCAGAGIGSCQMSSSDGTSGPT